MAFYELGNCLRGYYSGEFETDDEAWNELSDRFNRGFPSHRGRSVEMRKTVRIGLTSGGNAEPDPFYAKLKEAMTEKGVEMVKFDPVFGKGRS